MFGFTNQSEGIARISIARLLLINILIQTLKLFTGDNNSDEYRSQDTERGQMTRTML
jgi:hypothetical protein